MELTEVELRKLFEHFDQDQGGSIGYEEFIQGVRDPLTPRRLNLVQLAFAKIDRDGSGVVEPSEVVGAYNADKHPDVISGSKTADEVLREVRNCEEQIDEPECVKSASVSGCARSSRLDIDVRTSAMQF